MVSIEMARFYSTRVFSTMAITAKIWCVRIPIHVPLLGVGAKEQAQLNAFIQLESEAIGTSFAAGSATRDAVATQIRGNEWMIYVDDQSKEEHWDFVRRS